MKIKLCKDFTEFYDKVRLDEGKTLTFHKLGCDCHFVRDFEDIICENGQKRKHGYILCNRSEINHSLYKHAVTFPDDWDETKILASLDANSKFREECGKHRVAQCLLYDDHTNASVAIMSSSSDDIKTCIQTACEYKKIQSELYHDHFDYFYCFPLWLLQDLVKANQHDAKYFNFIIKSVVGIDLGKSLEDIKNIQFELKYNLDKFIVLSCDEGVHCDEFMMVGVDVSKENGRFTLQLNLPGGKRHLNETAVQTAQRELYEETSLILPLQRDCKEKLIYLQSKDMRFFICKPLSNKCTTLMELIPKFKSKQRCRICLQNKNRKTPRQSREGCLGCREIVCAECFQNYDHNPSSRKQISHRKGSKSNS